MLQTLRLGLVGSESLLPSESRTFNTVGITEFSRSGRSIDGTLRKDFINNKRTFTVSWDVLPQASLDLIESIYQLQFSNGTFLNFIVSDKIGGTRNYTVSMAAFSWSHKTFVDDWYYSGVSLTFEEV
jgi:hypothetical protein